jgi:hypothetical protein
MQTREDVQAMLKLAPLGWGAKRISRELGRSRNPVRSYLRQGGWQPYQSPQRAGTGGHRSGGALHLHSRPSYLRRRADLR